MSHPLPYPLLLSFKNAHMPKYLSNYFYCYFSDVMNTQKKSETGSGDASFIQSVCWLTLDYSNSKPLIIMSDVLISLSLINKAQMN